MTIAEIKQHVLELDAEERVELALDLWESVGDDVPVPAWQQRLVRERAAQLETMDEASRSTPWDEVKRRVFAKLT